MSKLIIEIRKDLPKTFYKDGGVSILVEEMMKAINESLKYAKDLIQPQLPVGATGNLQRNLTIEPAVSKYKGRRIEGRLTNKYYSKRYAYVVELGRTAGSKMPPKGSLIRWIKAKKGLSDKEAKRIEFAVRQKISQNPKSGTFTWARNMNRINSFTMSSFEKHINTYISRFKGMK